MLVIPLVLIVLLLLLLLSLLLLLLLIVDAGLTIAPWICKLGNDGTTNSVTTANMIPMTINAAIVNPQINRHLFYYHISLIFVARYTFGSGYYIYIYNWRWFYEYELYVCIIILGLSILLYYICIIFVLSWLYTIISYLYLCNNNNKILAITITTWIEF